jgi:glucose/arabinose dehydrogenase
MKSALAIVVWLTAVYLSGCSDDTRNPAANRANEAILNTAEAPTDIALPPGFTATVFADDLGAARHLAVRDNGDVFVTTRNSVQLLDPDSSTGGLIALRDTDGDGDADQIEYFGRGDTNTGMAIHDNHLYYSSGSTVYAIELDNQLAPRGRSEVVVTGFGNSGFGHSGKPITFDDEGHMYLQAGVPSNACQAGERVAGSPGITPCPQLERFGGVWRFAAASRGQDQLADGIRYSTGHRNAVALEWNPVSGELFLAMHGRDSLDTLFPDHYTTQQRQELPAEEFHVLERGDDLGWPYTYFDPLRDERMLAPEYGGDGRTPAQPGLYKDPLIAFPAHWAPNDLLFYTGEQFPERYYGGAFIAFHGSWNREPGLQGGYAIVFVPMQDGRPIGNWEIFADDFEGAVAVTSPASARHRPAGLAQGPDGSLYISDDAGGRIWKVRYTGD